jgi:hypothetical protein
MNIQFTNTEYRDNNFMYGCVSWVMHAFHLQTVMEMHWQWFKNTDVSILLNVLLLTVIYLVILNHGIME